MDAVDQQHHAADPCAPGSDHEHTTTGVDPTRLHDAVHTLQQPQPGEVRTDVPSADPTTSRTAAEPDPFSIREDDQVPAAPADFEGDAWVEQHDEAPTGGWRGLLHRATGGRVNPGLDPADARIREWIAEIRRPFGGARTVAVVSTKGGVGKTTTTVTLGHTLASLRGDRVVALDANPDAGSLGYRVPQRSGLTAADLLAEADHIHRYADIRHFTNIASSNLEVVASPDDPRLTRRLGRPEYERLLDLLRVHYNMVVADCGTGILDAATRGVVQQCDQLVVVTAAAVDSARAVSYLLDWLREHGLQELVEQTVVVVNAVRPGRRPVDVDQLVAHFAERVREVVVVPFDAELADGGAVELDWLAPATRQAHVRLAAAVVDGVAANTIDLFSTGEHL